LVAPTGSGRSSVSRTARLSRTARDHLRSLGSGGGESSGADPLGLLWRFLQTPTVWYACLGAAVLLALTAALFPRSHIPDANAFGWPVQQWPGGYQRLMALILLGSSPWSKVVLAALAVASIVRAASPRLPLDPADSTLDHRTPVYSERNPASVEARLRLAAGLVGYRLRREGEDSATLTASSDWAGAVAHVGISLALAALALVCLAAPRVTVAEVVDLAAGYPLQSAASGLLLTASAGPEPEVGLERAGTTVRLRRGVPIRLADLVVAWHGSGPALQVAPVAEDAEADALIVPFLPDEYSKYIAVPEPGVALRATLTDAGAFPSFQVQPLTRQGQPAGDAYEVAEPTEYALASAALGLTPTHYQVVSVARLPLWWAGAAALLLLAASLLVGVLWGRPLRLAIGESTGVTTLEVESESGSLRHRLFLVLTRRLLR